MAATTPLPAGWRRRCSTATLEAIVDDPRLDDDELDDVLDELERRAHDLEDPSSGLGCHRPS